MDEKEGEKKMKNKKKGIMIAGFFVAVAVIAVVGGMSFPIRADMGIDDNPEETAVSVLP